MFASGATEFTVGKEKMLVANNYTQNSAAPQIATDYPPNFDENNPQAKGVILSFHQWPSVLEKELIINHLKTKNLIKKAEIKRFKVWIFDWPEWRTVVEAETVCGNLPDVSSLESCEPDYLLDTASYNDKTFPQQVVQRISQNDIRPEFMQPTISDSQQNENEESCSVASTQFDLLDGQLSDYWAQEMIGSDLLKEELGEADPVGKHLVEVFDVPPTHDVKVRNLISDEGDHSVLPELGDQVGITATPTTVHGLLAANRMLNEADEACADLNNPDQSSPQQGGGGSHQNPPNPGGGNPNQNPPNPGGGNPNQNPPNQGGGSNQNPPEREVANQQQQGSSSQVRVSSSPSPSEIVTHGGEEYIVLSTWANNRHQDLSGVITRFSDELESIENPYIEGLRAAGESYSPTVYVVPDTASNREKFEQFVQHRGRTVHNRNLSVMWKTGTDWTENWKSPVEGSTPSTHHDLTADYEVDQAHDQNRSIFARREYRYLFRPPVLDIVFGGTSSTEYFNWLPPIVLGPNNKLKIWGTRVVGEAPLTINGVSVTLTEVPGTISDIPGSGKIHGRFEAVLTSTQYNQMLAGSISTSTNGNVGGNSDPNIQQQQANKNTNGNVNDNPPANREQESENEQTNKNPNPNVERDTASAPEVQEVVTYGGTEYILIRDWVNNRSLGIASLIFFLERESIELFEIDNPYAAALIAAGKSWSPTVYAIPNTNYNRVKLEQFAREQAR